MCWWRIPCTTIPRCLLRSRQLQCCLYYNHLHLIAFNLEEDPSTPIKLVFLVVPPYLFLAKFTCSMSATMHQDTTTMLSMSWALSLNIMLFLAFHILHVVTLKIIDHCHLSQVVSLLDKLLISQRVSVGLKNSCMLWCWTNYLKMFVTARKYQRVCMRSSTRDGKRWQWWLPVQCLDALCSFVNRPLCVSSHKKNFLFFQDRAISKMNSKFDPWILAAWHWTLVSYKLI